MIQLLKWTSALAGVALMSGTALAQDYDYGDTAPSQNGFGNTSPWRVQERQQFNQGQSYGTGQTSNPQYEPYNPQQSGNQPSQTYGSQPYGSQSGNSQQGWSQNQGQNQGQSQGWSQNQNQNGSQWAGQGQQQQQQPGRFCDAKRLIGEDVNDQQGQTVGHIRDITFNTQNGQIFAVVGVGNNQDALVPIQSLNISGTQRNTQVILNSGRSLQNGPLVQKGQWQQALNNPGFTQRLYSHYNLQPTSEFGVVVITPATPMGGTGEQNGESSGWSNQNSDSNRSGNTDDSLHEERHESGR